MICIFLIFFFFFFNDTATTEIYTLSLHDALPILGEDASVPLDDVLKLGQMEGVTEAEVEDIVANNGKQRFRDRKSTRLNSSHDQISYAVFCLKKKKKNKKNIKIKEKQRYRDKKKK